MVGGVLSAFECPEGSLNSVPLSVEERVEVVRKGSDGRLRAVVELGIRNNELEVVSKRVSIGIQSSSQLVTHCPEVHRVQDDVEVVESASFDRIDRGTEQEGLLVFEELLENTLARSDIMNGHARSLGRRSFRDVYLVLVLLLLGSRFFWNVERQLFERRRSLVRGYERNRSS